MKNSKLLKAYLILAGALLMFIGGATLFAPLAMKGGAGIDLEGNISVLNDVRAASALLLSLGLISFLGAIIKRLIYTSSLISFITLLALGLGRIISLVSDGMPVDGLVKATGLEMILGLLGAAFFLVFKQKHNQQH